MPSQSDIETADRLARKRARMLPALVVIFLAQQATYFTDQFEDGARTVDHVKIAAWLILSIVLLAALATGGFWFRPAPVRALMNDEITRANRAEAFRVGFLASMVGSIALYILTLFEPLDGREAIHLIMTIGLAAALLRFGVLERRAFRDE